jgi:hypothetical protein
VVIELRTSGAKYPSITSVHVVPASADRYKPPLVAAKTIAGLVGLQRRDKSIVASVGS